MIDQSNAGARRFEACLLHVLAHEGGYADHPEDPGGATNMGITRNTLAAWRKVSPASSLGKDQVMGLSRSEAADIYRGLYWDTCGADRVPPGFDLALFDFAVNSGPSRAVKTLQAILKVPADGIIGPVTLRAIGAGVRAGRTRALINGLCDSRLGFLERLATFATFGRGWTRRVGTIRAAALAMAHEESTARSNPMDFLSGYKTYIVAGLMALAALAQLLGVPLPATEGQSGLHLLMEAFGLIFLRRGIQKDTGQA